MGNVLKRSAAMVLLGICIAVSGLCPVQAEDTVSGYEPVTEHSVENGTVSGGDAADCGSDAAGTDGSGDAAGSAAGTGAGDMEPGEAGEGGSGEEGGTVSGGDGAADTEDPAGTDSSGGGPEDINADADAGAGGDTGGPEDEPGEEGISPYDLTVYPDDRLMQWNMGNSSGKYGNSFDTYAVDDNVIAALYGLGNDTYRLELTGTGEMAGLGHYDYQPYKAYRNKIVSVTVGEGITNVGSEAFARFSKLQEYTLPASVKTIGESAFEYCTSLKSVVIPDTVDSLSHYCFQHCEGAESLTIPGDLDYNGLNIPFYDMKNLKDIYITPGKTGAASVSQVTGPTSSPANISDGYTIHFTEGVTEIHDKVFANTKASRIEIANSVTVIGADAFAKKAYDTSTIPDYIVLGDNTRSIAFRAFMASVQTITPTTVEIGNVYQYEYDWAAVRREVTFVVRLNALKELAGMVEKDIADGVLSQAGYPAAKWKELQGELSAAKRLVDEGNSDLNMITGSFIRLYDLYHYEVTAGFIITVPAEVRLTEDVENNRVIGVIPVKVEYLCPVGDFSLYLDEGSFAMQDKLSGKNLPLEIWPEDGPGDDSTYGGYSTSLWLAGERLAGDWEGTVRLTFTCGE